MPGDDVEPIDLRNESWIDALPAIRERLSRDHPVRVRIPRASFGAERWRGESGPDGRPHLGLRDWLDLAEFLHARVHGPIPAADASDGSLLLRLEPIGPESEIHGRASDDRYAIDGAFARVRKASLPGFRLPLLEAIAFASGVDRFASAPAAAPDRVLVVGCHRGDEIDVLAAADPAVAPERVVGVDHNAAALDEARRRHPAARFVDADLARLEHDDPLPIAGRFDLVVAVSVLQSPQLDGAAVLRGLVRHHTTDVGGVIVGLPASRYRDGEILWGARTRNYAEIDLSLVVRDLAGHRRYLHQHGYRTRIGGRYDLLLTARRNRAETKRPRVS